MTGPVRGADDKEPLIPAKRGAGRTRDAGVQLRRPHGDGWTARKKRRFLEVLRATCNVQEAVRSAGMSSSGLYSARKADPEFAAGWAEALEHGYCELEMMLLRQSLHGSQTTETIDDGGKGGGRRTKTVHSFPHLTALRLLLAHKNSVHSYRAERGIEHPGGEAVRTEIQRKIEEMRMRSGGVTGDDNKKADDDA